VTTVAAGQGAITGGLDASNSRGCGRSENARMWRCAMETSGQREGPAHSRCRHKCPLETLGIVPRERVMMQERMEGVEWVLTGCVTLGTVAR
jgi:hypothetical protein